MKQPTADAVKTVGSLIVEMYNMGITCFSSSASELPMALPAFLFDVALEDLTTKQFDYSKPSKKNVQPKVGFSPTDEAMAILSLIAYGDGAKGEIKNLLFKKAVNPVYLLGKNPGDVLVTKGVNLSEASYHQTSSYVSAKGKPCWFCVADEQKKVVYVVIRGTEDAGDILSDLNIKLKDIVVSGQTAKVHSGVYGLSFKTLDLLLMFRLCHPSK